MPNEPQRVRRRSSPLTALRCAGALALIAFTGACAVTPAPAPPAVSGPATPGQPAPPTSAAPGAAPAAATAPSAAPANATGGTGSAHGSLNGGVNGEAPGPTAASAAGARENGGVPGLLRYADRVRVLAPPELALEIAALGEPGPQAARQLQLAIALMHSNQPVDTARALGLAQRAAASPAEEAAPYRPFARLLVNRLMEQRKLEDTAERQTQLARDLQRRIDQLNDRLEAMRAIERSINNRAPARPPTP